MPQTEDECVARRMEGCCCHNTRCTCICVTRSRGPPARMVRLRPEPTTAVPPDTHVLAVSLMAPAKPGTDAAEAARCERRCWKATMADGGLPASRPGAEGGARRERAMRGSSSLDAVHRGFGGTSSRGQSGSVTGDLGAIVFIVGNSLDAMSISVTAGAATALPRPCAKKTSLSVCKGEGAICAAASARNKTGKHGTAANPRPPRRIALTI